MKHAFTEEEIEAIYTEVDRRIDMDIQAGEFENFKQVREYREAMCQGVYSVLMTLSKDWPSVAGMCVDTEIDRYGRRQW